MATETEEVGYMLLVDGIATAFVTDERINDTYAQLAGFDRTYPGLKIPSNLPVALDLNKGVFTGPSSASFKLDDIDGTLAALFGGNLDNAEPLLVKVPAGTANLGASLHGKCIGTETIGSAGQRRRYSCVPGYHVGPEHIAEQQANAVGIAAAPVSDAPILWAGRRCCLYRLTRSSSGTWTSLLSQENRERARVWFGTLLGTGTQVQRRWTLRAAGPESWLMGTLGAAVPQRDYRATVDVKIDTDQAEHVLVAKLDVVSIFAHSNVLSTYFDTYEDTTSLVGVETYDQLTAAFNSFLGAVASEGVDPLNSYGQSNLYYNAQPGADGVHVVWDRGAQFVNISAVYSLRLRLVAHEVVWKALGYDPAVQNANLDPIENQEQFGLFATPIEVGLGTASIEFIDLGIQYPNHWVGTFFAADALAMSAMLQKPPGSVWAENTNANGFPRRWPPIYSGGTSIFRLNETQVFRLSYFDPAFLAGANTVPLPASPENPGAVFNIPGVGDVTHQGIVAFSGPFRDETNPEAEPTNITLPARVAWRETPDGSLATDAQGYPTLAVYEWPEPKLYGFEDPRPGLWASWRVPPEDGEPLLMRPLLVLEHGNATDVAGYALAQLMVSTGAGGGWFTDDTYVTPAYGLGTTAVQEVGPNDLGLAGIGDEKLGRFTDAQAPGFALGVPAELIAADASEQAGIESALADMADADLYRCKAVFGKVLSALDAMKTLLAPFGWSLSLAGGKFGMFDPFEFKPPGSASGVVTVESLAGKPGDPSSAVPTQQLRKSAPVDRLELRARVDPITGNYAQTEAMRSPDPGLVYRAQSKLLQIDGPHMLHPTLPDTNWQAEWYLRWGKIARFWASQHYEAKFTVPASRSLEFWPGSVVSISNPWLVNPNAGTYGIAQSPGYVTSRVFNAEKETIEVTAIVSASLTKLYAPSARVTRYDEDDDAQGFRLLCDDDYLGIRGNTGTFDVDGFVKPDWATGEGNAAIEVFQSIDGVVWTGGIYGTVESINAAAGSCWIKLTGALTGATWYRDRWHIAVLRKVDEQTATWPLACLAPVGGKDGTYDGVNKSPKFKD